MLCQNCGAREATAYFKQTVNGQTREMHLCPTCAAKLSGGWGFGSMSDPFQSLLHWDSPFTSDFFPSAPGLSAGRRCPTCGLTEGELRRTGRAGCGDCYTAFSDVLMPYIRKLQGATAHVPTSRPAAAGAESAPKTDPVATLRQQLDEAIRQENYEQAARLRDEIRRLEGEK